MMSIKNPNTRGNGLLVDRTILNRGSVIHVLAVILCKTFHFFFIFPHILIEITFSGKEISPLLIRV